MSNTHGEDTSEQAAFRAHCRSWLQAHRPEPPSVRLPQSPLEIIAGPQLQYLQAWQRAAYAGGLVGCDYPRAVGGGGRTDCQRIANAEMQAARTPFFPNIIGLGMAAPTVLLHGQRALAERLLPPLFSGEEIWCQGFSEPGAGSDLAAVQTFAERRGNTWIINGHKVWTSLAHVADWMILLARTDRQGRHGGLSYFVVPIRQAMGCGVTVRPLIKMTGETGFNEVLFADLEIGDDYRLDEVGRGWQVAMTTLLHERDAGQLVTPRAGGMISATAASAHQPRSLLALGAAAQRDGRDAASDPVLRDRLMQLMIRAEGQRQNQRRSRVTALLDHPMRLPLQNKLLASEIAQQTAALALELLGPAGTLYLGDPAAPAGGQWPLAYMNSYGYTIAAGSSEVQRNILGERVLGLPKSH